MPSRVIRGEINASYSLSAVSMLADLTFRALLVAVDDWGRIDGRLPVLKGALFPARDEVTHRKLDGWLAELAAGHDPLIVRYEVDGRPYIQLAKWEKHRSAQKRAAASRIPGPIPGDPRKSADPPENSGPLTLTLGLGLGGGLGGGAPGESPDASPAPRSKSRHAPRIDPRVEEAWPQIREAFGQHGVKLGERVGHDRAELIAKRLDEGASPEDLVCAVHGYVQLHDGLKPDPKSGFNPRKWFQPQTVFKHEAFSDRVDAGRNRNVRQIDDERRARLMERWRV